MEAVKNNFNLRRYSGEDIYELIKLFQDTVRNVNSQDYTPEQINVWAPDIIDEDAWHTRLKNNHSVVVTDGDLIVAFGELTITGLIFSVYVRKEYMRQGIGKRLVHELEKKAVNLELSFVRTEASISARPFFEKLGYHLIEEQDKLYKGLVFKNYKMGKDLKKK